MKRFLPISMRALAALGLTLFATIVVAQTTLYKYVGPDGKVVYSDKPPPKGVKYDTMTPDTRPSGFNPRATNTPPTAAEVDASIQARRDKEVNREARVAEAKATYDAAVSALAAGQEPREGERTQNSNGTSRLNEGYFNRVAELQNKVEEAKSALDAAQNE
jgi:hypothetical protein